MVTIQAHLAPLVVQAPLARLAAQEVLVAQEALEALVDLVLVQEVPTQVTYLLILYFIIYLIFQMGITDTVLFLIHVTN